MSSGFSTGERRDLAIGLGVVSAVACIAGILVSDVSITFKQPVYLVATLVAFGLGAGTTVGLSCYLFIDQSVLTPMLGASYVVAVVIGLFLGAQSSDPLLAVFPALGFFTIIAGSIEYVVRSLIGEFVGMIAPRPLV
ncbi:hypothetical protein [Halobacterium salinarum]|uniref:hypothetical protein n=1 Tax=Halobacterium salinarum TaxID=2242 RepID=UPI001F40A717|nr:hypothetical protein [Halobacterium salinarum]